MKNEGSVGDALSSQFLANFQFHTRIQVVQASLMRRHVSTHSYDFSSRKNCFVPRRFGYSPRPNHGDRFLRRPGFPAGESYTHFEPRYLDGPHFTRRGSRST
jgi:hypothetical protein